MPVEIAAEAGERFEKDGTPSAMYRRAGITVFFAAGEDADVRIPCAFKPDRITVDPDARVLQLQRENTIARL